MAWHGQTAIRFDSVLAMAIIAATCAPLHHWDGGDTAFDTHCMGMR